MTLNFNTQPYFDDFDDNKNYHKILFKPGVAVQARELTQIQSILQDQIGKFGKFVLSDGSKVTGGRYFIDTNTLSLKLSTSNLSDLSNNIQYFTGSYIVGATSKCLGKITNADITNYYLTVKSIINGSKNFSSGESLKIFSSKALAMAYLNNSSITSDYSATLDTDTTTTISGVYGTINSTYFSMNTVSLEVGDLLKIQSSENPYDSYIVTEITTNGVAVVNKPLDEDYSNVIVSVTKLASRYVMEVGFDSGVYFTNANFVKALPQTIIPNLKTQYPSCVIGYEVTETIIDFVDDTSLLDPAQGSYNYTAPGADRYKIYLELVSKPLVSGEIQDLTNNKFIELLRIKNGNIVSDTTGPILGAIEDVLARQMYDHAGNFIVKDFNISFHGSDFVESTPKMQAELSPGKAYVFGYEFNHRSPSFFSIDKGRDVASSTNNEMMVYYGNRISITNPSGEFLNAKSSSKVELHSTDATTANSSTLVATAYVRNLKQVSDTEYYLNLYNISSSDISSVKSIVKPSNISYSSLTFSANTVLTSGLLPIVDSDYNSLLFQLPYNYVSSLSNVQFSTDIFETLTVVGNSVTIHTNSLDKIFSAGLGTLSSDLKKSTFVIVTNDTNGAYVSGTYVNLNDVSIVIQQGISEYTATITFTNGYSGQIGIKYSLDILNATPKTKTEYSGYVAKVSAKTSKTTLGIADISNFIGVFHTPYSDNPNITVNYIGGWYSGTTYSKYNVVLVGDVLYVSNEDNNLNTKPDSVNTKWSKLEDVTSKYILNNGQTDAIYDHGYISAKNYTDEKEVFVLFDYYTHSTTGDYINYSSYPTQYSKIPVNTINNKIYDMKNFVDFRPRRSNNVTSYSFDDYKIPSTLFDGIMFDMQYYLGRIDKLILNDSKKFQWLRGIPSYTNYIPPADLNNAMTIATIQINPFTGSSSDISITYKKHRRYTMDDIGNLDQRLSNVEYYTSLNMVEKDVMSRNIYDTITGQRMTNGFVVDPFVGYGTMSIADNYFNCSLDLDNQILRPSFKTVQFDPYIKDLGTLNQQAGIVSFDFTEKEITNQLSATSTENCNPFDVISYSGDLILSPQSDNWVDSEKAPIINVINEDTAALSTAISVPGQVYNDWNTFYSTHQYSVDSNYTNKQITVQNAINQVIYDVTAALVKTSDTTKELSSSIIPFARSTAIKFSASNLTPLTKMYVYVNGRLVNGYIIPSENPTGKLETITVTSRGSNYSAGNTSVEITGANTSAASISLAVTSGVITGAEFTAKGLGYGSGTANNIPLSISGTGTGASLLLSTFPVLASDLYSNEYGVCSGTLSLPNDDILSFPSGELHLVICDNPNYDFNNCISKAEATFYSSGKHVVTQETITSIREPYITIVGQNDKPSPTQGAAIVVPSTRYYTVRDDLNVIPYSTFQSGTISIPVYLNKQPNSSVTVTYTNSTSDQSANTSYSISPSSLTFSTSNWDTPQSFTLSYDLGARPSFSVDNNLFSYLEFYGSSTDTGYNYTGAQPAKSWINTSLIGVSNCKLIQESKAANTTPSAQITCDLIPTMSGSGQTEFIATPSGVLLPDYLPITFTITSSNTSVCTVNGIYAPNSTVLQNTNTFTITKVADLSKFKIQLSFSDTGSSTATISVTSSCGVSYWNGVTGTTTFTHIASAPPISPAIVITPPASARKTTEDGGTTDIYFHLSKQPSTNVYVTATSSDTTEGTITGKRQDGSTLVAGNNMVVFTSSDWSTDKAIQVTGVSDSSVDGDISYTVNLTSASSNTSWNSLTASASVVNIDKTVVTPPPVVNGTIVATANGPKAASGYPCTTTAGGKITINVSLSKQPGATVTVSGSVSAASLGSITSGSSLTFTTSNWNIAQPVVITGGIGNSFSIDSDYSVSFSATTSGTPAFDSTTVQLTNQKVSTTFTKTTPISSSTYKVISDLDPATWVPSIAIDDFSLVTFGNLAAVHWADSALDPTWVARGGANVNKNGSAQIWGGVVVSGAGPEKDEKADGWVIVNVTLSLGSTTTWLKPGNLPTGLFTAEQNQQYTLYKNYATSGGQNPSYQFKIIDDKTKNKIQFHTMLYEQWAKEHDPNWLIAQNGWAQSYYNFGGMCPNFSYYNAKVSETKTSYTKVEVFDSISNQLISSTTTDQQTSTNIVWEWKPGSETQQKIPSQEVLDTLSNWLKQFPSLTQNWATGNLGYTGLVDALNTLL